MRPLFLKYRKFLRRRQPHENRPVRNWEMVYTGFILILLCFFIMLSSFATMEASRLAPFVRAFTKAVSVLPGGLNAEPGREIVPPSARMVPVDSELARLFDELKSTAATFGLEDDVTIELAGGQLKMRLSDRAAFDTGSARISSGILPLLEKAGLQLSGREHLIRIEGHTDNIPIRNAQFESNWELSTARAVSVLRYFLDRFNIPASRLSAAGFGPFQPLAANDNATGRAANRRVEIILTAPQGHPPVPETQQKRPGSAP